MKNIDLEERLKKDDPEYFNEFMNLDRNMNGDIILNAKFTEFVDTYLPGIRRIKNG